MRGLALLLFVTSTACLADPPSDAFTQGSSFGRGSLSGARGTIHSGATSSVPQFNPNPPERGHFDSSGLNAAAAHRAQACASATDPACAAVRFSQTNPTQRSGFTIGPDDPLLTRAKTITADPQSIAGNLAGTYGACEVRTVTPPAIYETRMCHATRGFETQRCERILTVTPVSVAGCSPGQFLTRVTVDPCPTCPDYVAFDFSCGTNAYVLHATTQLRFAEFLFQDLGTVDVPGSPGLLIPRTAGPSHVDGITCYQTFFSQACTGSSCTIRASFVNPCQGTAAEGERSFPIPLTTTFTDRWDDRCSTLEARTR